MSTYDGRRGVRWDRVCKPVATHMVAVMQAPGEAIDEHIAFGQHQVVARREEFGRTVLDLTGDMGEPDVGPQKIDLSVDEATGTTLAVADGPRWAGVHDRVLGQARPVLVGAESRGARRTREDARLSLTHVSVRLDNGR